MILKKKYINRSKRGIKFKKMKRINFITIIACVCITMLVACSKSEDNPSADSVKWNGSELSFKAKEELRLTGVSVVAGGKEYRATSISNLSGNMGSTNGATFREGSSLSFSSVGTFVIFAGTTVKCTIDNASGKASKAYLYLDSGSKIEIKL